MEYHIIVNSNVYKKYKDEIIKLNVRLFCDDNYTNIKNYIPPIDLTGIIDYLPYCEKIFIESTTTFLDYINILLILSFLNAHDYTKKVIINYYNLQEKNYNKAVFTSLLLKKEDYMDIKILIKCLMENIKLPKLILQIPGSINFINFHNNLVDKELFKSLIAEDIDKFDGDIDEIAAYLENRFSQFNLSKKFYKDYLTKE